MNGALRPSRAKAREASISTSRSKLHEVSRVVSPSSWVATVLTFVVEDSKLVEDCGVNGGVVLLVIVVWNDDGGGDCIRVVVEFKEGEVEF